MAQSGGTVDFFAENAQFVDVYGKRWNRDEIRKEFKALFAPYAKKNATYIIEETLADNSDLLIVIVLWKNAILASLAGLDPQDECGPCSPRR
jgi:hypothetical protein